MNFRQRFFRYLIGVGIGVILSAYFFQGKGHLWTSWLPGNRVKERIVSSYWDIGPKTHCQLKCLELDIPELKEELKKAEVDFKNSNTNQEPKEYRLVLSDHSKLNFMTIAVKDSIAIIQTLEGSIACDCP